MGVHKCIRYGQLACFGRHYECWKVYKGFRATYAPLQTTSISGKALCISAGLSNHPTTCPLDPIPSYLLQAISPAVVPALTHIINISLHTGVFPSAFRQARITPLLKKPTLNPSLSENYRSVSLLPFIAKTLERAVFNQVSAFLTQNNLLVSNQSGLRSWHSTDTALISVVEVLRLARVDSKSSILILLDLSAAFDTVNHKILLNPIGLSLTYQIGPSRYLGEVRCPSRNI